LGKHTESEFIDVMEKIKCSTKDCPIDVEGWIKWSGAERMPSRQCDKVVKGNERIERAEKEVEKYRKCVSESCKAPIGFARENTTDNNLSAVAMCAAMRCKKEFAKLAKSNLALKKVTKT
jgi:hypothetical protein